MEISPRKPSKRAQEPVDEWLQNEGYFRKHAPRDPTCLFRAVSEQVYLTQHYHIKVRRECVEFMRKMKHLFVEDIAIPFDDYLEQMACFTEWGGMNEIQAMSLLYKKEFIIFNGQKQIRRTVTNNGYKDAIYLCHTSQKQYESIYTKDFVATAAYCQSIVYQVLYKDVFHMPNIESTVHKMLHDRTPTFRHDKFFLKGNLEIRDQLAAEMYNRVENGSDEVDDTQTVTKGIPPFPYRVAKALDPNIYRNTDFDIWHEIRREVKNAGWTRHNSHELQVGGKCLVQMESIEDEFDKANNNSVYMSSLEKDSNGNDTKTLQRKGKQDPTFFCGHIQEMSKNQGPVLVFIEELGEKKIVPYTALKPLPLRKNKQNNWIPMCKRNVLFDSNQKWKKTYGTNSRKIKESITTVNVLSPSIDKNGNNNNCVNDTNKSNFQGNKWKEESSKMEHQQVCENYAMEKYTNYTVNDSGEIFSAISMLENTQPSMLENNGQEINKNCLDNSSCVNNNSDNGLSGNEGKCGSLMSIENNSEFNSHSKQRSQKETYCPSYIDSASNNQEDRSQRPVNSSVQKSVDVNGSDLPLSDPFTLRFFYNLGLEYFRVNHSSWNQPANGQSASFGQWYPGTPQNGDEIINITNGVTRDCTLNQNGEDTTDRKEISNEPVYQDTINKSMNGTIETQPQKTENSKDGGKNSLYPLREKVREQFAGNKDFQRTNRNGLAPRFKKNSDNRHRNAQQYSPQQQIHNSNQYQHNGPSFKPWKFQELKPDSQNAQHLNPVSPQVPAATGAPNSYHAPYVQQGIYPGVPYYTNEPEFGNPYYAPNAGFFPIPCVPHSDIPDNNNIQPYSPHLCPGVDYAQAYPGLCPPYICPQPAPYNMPPQNMPEHWYAVAGQPHYMQYAPVLPIAAETTCNSMGQNTSQSNTP